MLSGGFMNRVEAVYRGLDWWQKVTVQIYAFVHKLFCRDYDRAFERIVGRFKPIQSETSLSLLAEKVDRVTHSPPPEERDQALELDDGGSDDPLGESKEIEWHDKLGSITINLAASKLELKGAQITQLSPSIGLMTQLEYLNLNGSRIVEWPQSMENLQSLTEIHLDDIPELDSSILEILTKLPNLKIISLQRSLKEEVDDVIFMLPKGCKVFLGDNPFSEETKAMLQRANLNEEGPIFHLSSSINEKESVVIKSTPVIQHGVKKSLKEWPKFDPTVEKIDLSHNVINNVPENIKEYRQLKVLNLSDNKLDEGVLKNLCDVLTLEEMDLSNNNIDSVPVEIVNLKKLRILNLHMTGLERVPKEMWSLASLEELDLSHNPSLFYDEENEKTLTPFPEGVSYYNKLSKLDLSDCDLQDLPQGLLYLPDGCKIILRGNPLKESVRNYLNSYQGKLVFEF